MTAKRPHRLSQDIKGNKVSAIISIREFNKILEEREELEDIFLFDQSKNDNQPVVPKSKAMQMIELERKKCNL